MQVRFHSCCDTLTHFLKYSDPWKHFYSDADSTGGVGGCMSEGGCKGRMRGPATYLRRSLTLLEWIGSSYPEAKVAYGSVELGRWSDLCVRWQLAGDKIRLQMSWNDRDA